MRGPWYFEDPQCAEVGTEIFYTDKEDGLSRLFAEYARSVCSGCKHITECGEWGIHKEYFGVWGGLTPKDRKAIRRARRIVLEEEEEEVA
jgi:WhiB family redox-sensing transcriptional regulator